MWRCTMWRRIKFLGPSVVLAFSGCLPSDLVPSLVGSSISSVVGVLLTDALNVLVPPI